MLSLKDMKDETDKKKWDDHDDRCQYWKSSGTGTTIAIKGVGNRRALWMLVHFQRLGGRGPRTCLRNLDLEGTQPSLWFRFTRPTGIGFWASSIVITHNCPTLFSNLLYRWLTVYGDEIGGKIGN